MNLWRTVIEHFVPSSKNAYRPHVLKRSWLIFFLTIVLTTEGVFVAGLFIQQNMQSLVGAVLPGELIALTNTERGQNGVGTLQENTQLDAAAQAKANDMATKGYFAHVSPDGTVPWVWVSGAGYSYEYAGENLAVRFDNSSDVMNAWMASPTHRENIVKPVYTEIGIGVAEGTFEGSPATFVVQYFGAPLAAAAPVAPVVQKPTAPPVARPVAKQKTAVAKVSTESAPAQVAGAEVSSQQPAEVSGGSPSVPTVMPTARVKDSMVRQILRVLPTTSRDTGLVLGGVVALLVVALALAFFIHIEVQPTELLVGGAVLASVAFSFLALNSMVMVGDSTVQSAAVFDAVSQGYLGGDAASTAIVPSVTTP